MIALEEETVDRRIEGSGIFFLWSGKPIMVNSVLEGLRQRRVNEFHVCYLVYSIKYQSERGGKRALGKENEALRIRRIDMVVNRFR